MADQQGRVWGGADALPRQLDGYTRVRAAGGHETHPLRSHAGAIGFGLARRQALCGFGPSGDRGRWHYEPGLWLCPACHEVWTAETTPAKPR